MAISLRKKGGGGAPSIPTASTGDVAFLIMIFFMSTSMFAKEKGLKIVLPEPTPPGQESQVKLPPQNLLNVGVNSQGQVQVSLASEPQKAEYIDVPQLRELVVDRLAANKDLVISLRVSRGAPYRVMIDVFDQLKLAKASRISLLHVADMGEEGGP
ncbi:biopolymer transporter ExbD [candidate division WOR-3 bacterium]|uniref:Biopolymer transporter ExbD n=1 Tax=candidate division WOR-3 bacterium TaxID=2052148 RepID=A0A937XHB6_UNCW3|nr:biopolymer transporter ExbD [candidate division WOR-3 bacterium]